ncbi:class I adenylate-forming enzyme family protein [Solibacillus silvestris]|uniref:class I adenylate-forming enzyme family protein n=1 Tax=Solibacillus silvestris TaxID=76853 RepID=UPI003F80C2B1
MGIQVGQILASRAKLSGEKVGFINGDKKITFTEMNNRANAFAAFLQNQGLQSGDKIALLCKNNEDVVAAFFGAAKLGIITVVLNYRLQAEELDYIYAHSDAQILVHDAVFHELVNQLKTVKRTISHKTSPSLADVFEEKAIEPVQQTSGDDPIIMMYTSGTTGRPKGALISHNNLQAASIGLSHTIDWWEQDRFLMVAPFFHIGGFAPLVTNVHTGATMVLMEDFHPVEAWKLIEKERITTSMTVPAMLAFLLQTYPMVKTDISTLRYFTCGASAVPAPLILGCRQLGIPIQQVYGITEYTGAVSFWKASQNEEKYDSMGKVVMQGTVRIKDLTTKEELPTGEVGEIVLTGPQIFVGYYKNDEAYHAVVKDDEFYTGDVGYVDNEGFLYVVDRVKDMIISGGENIYSAELELILAQHDAIQEVAVIGRPDEKWGEVPVAYIVKKAEHDIASDEVIDYCKSRLASYKAVKDVVFVEALPRNAVGKILKMHLKELQNS